MYIDTVKQTSIHPNFMRFFSVTLSLTAVILLFVTGCENAAVADALDPVHEEVLERPGIINNEPGRLVKALNQIYNELQADPDSAKLVEA